jgi:hypothetical protein
MQNGKFEMPWWLWSAHCHHGVADVGEAARAKTV